MYFYLKKLVSLFVDKEEKKILKIHDIVSFFCVQTM